MNQYEEMAQKYANKGYESCGIYFNNIRKKPRIIEAFNKVGYANHEDINSHFHHTSKKFGLRFTGLVKGVTK